MKTFAAVVMFAPLVCSLAQSNLDAPAKAEVVTVRSEIKRGCDEVSAAKLPDDPEEQWQAAKKIINENDRIGRKTDGFVLGVHFRIWLALEIVWELYPAGSLGKLSADAAGGIAWLSVQGDLKRTRLTTVELIAVTGSGDLVFSGHRPKCWHSTQTCLPRRNDRSCSVRRNRVRHPAFFD